MQEKNSWIMYDLQKKFFKQTLDTFRTSAQNNNELLQKFDIVFKKIIESKQLNDVDLFELATEYKTLKRTENKNTTEKKQPETKKIQSTTQAKNEISKFPVKENKSSNASVTQNESDLLQSIIKARNEKKYLTVINQFENNFLNPEQSSKVNITQTYLHLYAKSLLDLVN
jgi:hypothetical protein